MIPLRLPLLLILLLLLAFGHPAAAGAQSDPQRSPAAPDGTLILLPEPSDLDGVHNYLRGPHQWRDAAWPKMIPIPSAASRLMYERFDWSRLETAPGEYDFSIIDRHLADAHANGQRFFFRVRAMHEEFDDRTRYFPEHIPHWRRPDGTPIPDWNAPEFLDGVDALFAALDRRYGDDPTLIGLDIGMYATWGEWSLSSSIYNAAPPGVKPATFASLKRMIDSQANHHFENKWHWMAIKPLETMDAAIYALQNPLTGWRTNGVGNWNPRYSNPSILSFDTDPRYAPLYAAMKDKWRTVPVVSEFFNPKGPINFQRAVSEHIDKWHISTVGNGNIKNWSSYSSADRNAMLEIMLRAGYRYRIRQVTLPDALEPGTQARLAVTWENLGSAPAYEDIHVQFQLVNPSTGKVETSWRSAVDLKQVYKEQVGDETVTTFVDSVYVSHILSPGPYQLRVLLLHPTGEVQIANQGRQRDGSYILGRVVVK